MKLGLSHQKPEQLSVAYLNYLKQMGVERIEVRILSQNASFDKITAIKDKVESAGLELHEIMLNDKYSAPEICLGLDGRDDSIALLKQFIKDLGRAGITHTTYAWHTGGAYQTSIGETRGCPTRVFELEEALALANSYDCEYSDELMWQNYEYFIKEVLPVAEDAGVKLQLHPNDPPVSHQGIARIFRSTEAFRRAMAISNYSPYSGILFCVGCWAEMFGSDGKGEDIIAAIREFGSQRFIQQVHFRNISQPMPKFKETFPDNGYVDLPAIVQTLAEVGYEGMLVPDHVPDTSTGAGGEKAGEAFILGYIRGLIQSVQSSAKT